jgi:hypothetical protein
MRMGRNAEGGPSPGSDGQGCTLFERGHHAHPMQVSMALKKGGDDW